MEPSNQINTNESHNDNIKKQLHTYRQALEEWTQESHPKNWASTQYKLGNTLRKQFTTNRDRDYIKESIECYQLVLQVWTRESNPQDWAMTQNNMGLAFRDRISGNRKENIDSAVECYRLALQVWTRESNPEDWATTQNNMGLAFRDRISGNCRENIDSAIECYRLALQVRTRESNPEYWAMTQNNMGLALRNRISGDRRENIDSAMECYRLALQVYTRESNPHQWAATQNNMGKALWNRISGDRRENIDSAIECCRLALQICTRESNPHEWVRLQGNIGIALWYRISGDRRENIDSAIECYRLALQVCTRESNPHEWARLQNNIAVTLPDRISGDRRENIDSAIECYRLALQVWTRESNPHEWARLRNNMGCALSGRISGDRRENIDSAINCYQLALQVWTRESNPEDWAMTQSNMGCAFRDRISGNRRENTDSAIECHRLALQVRTRESNPHEWANTQNQMGLALIDRISGDRRENIDSAIECYQRALQIYTQESSPSSWGYTQKYLGIAYLAYDTEERNNNLSNAKLAIENFFGIFSLEMNPLTFLTGHQPHTQLYLHIGSVPEIITSCQQGLQAVDYAKSLSSAGLLHSRHLDERYASFANNLMSMHFHEGRYETVLEVFDRNKASLLLSLISGWDDPGSKLSEEDKTKLEESKSRYKTLKYELDMKPDKGEQYQDLKDEFQMVQTDIDDLVKTVDHRRGQDVLEVSGLEMIEFVKRKNVIGIVFFYAGEYKRLREGDSSKSLHAICILNGELSGYIAGEELKYVRSYETAKMFSDERALQYEGENMEQWKVRWKGENEFLEKVGRFLSSILDDLRDKNPEFDLPNRLVIVPHHILSKVPFCAVPIRTVPIRTGFDGYSGTEPRFLGDVFRGGIWMLPSMSIGVRIDRKKTMEQAKKLTECKVVSATCPTLLFREQYDKTLREEIGNKVNSQVHIADPYPPREKIKMNEDVKDCDILHLTCHGMFAGRRDAFSVVWNPSSVLNRSVLSFGSLERDLESYEEKEEKNLNMIDIWRLNLKECRLVNVVACSGGAVNVLSQSDESLSIGTGFLVAGARNVICCAWPVKQLAAAIIMDRLYKNMCRGENGENGMWKLGEYLGEVQRWYRELGVEESLDLWGEYDPDGKVGGLRHNERFYSWGAFMIVGPPD